MKCCSHQFHKTKNLKLFCDSFYSLPVQYFREHKCSLCGASDWRRDKMYRRGDQ